MSDQPKSTFAKRARAAKPREKRYDTRDDVIPGLFLRVFPTGARSFALDRMTRGRRRFATLGNADAMTIPEAARRPALPAAAPHSSRMLSEQGSISVRANAPPARTPRTTPPHIPL